MVARLLGVVLVATGAWALVGAFRAPPARSVRSCEALAGYGGGAIFLGLVLAVHVPWGLT